MKKDPHQGNCHESLEHQELGKDACVCLLEHVCQYLKNRHLDLLVSARLHITSQSRGEKLKGKNVLK